MSECCTLRAKGSPKSNSLCACYANLANKAERFAVFLLGAKCNMAVFKAKKPAASDNCLLFHCDTEQDCPLMMAGDGVNTYDIFKGNRGNVHGPSSPSL